MQSFLDMGGYATYVWPAYGVTALVLVGLFVASVVGLKRRQRQLERLGGGRERRS